MENYRSNSNRSKQQPDPADNRKVEKVINGVAKVKKKSDIRKFADNFISEDAGKVGSYLFTDVIVPGIVKIITDSFKDGVDIIFKGASGRNTRNSGNYQGNYVSYNNFSNRNNDTRRPAATKQVHSPSDITLPSRSDAEAVLNQLKDMLSCYGAVTVADLYDSVGISHSFTDVKYGWTDLRNADVARDADGWYVKLPNAYPLDR